LRAISIALVMASHLLRNTQVAGHVRLPVGEYGNFGVRVFFVISGYLITSILLKEHQRTGTIDLRRFYVRRAYRIFPAAYVYMAIMIALFWREMTFRDVVAAVAYLRNWVLVGDWYLGHLWSLSVEEQFYLLWPLLLATLFAFRARIGIAAMVIAPVFRLALYRHGMGDAAGTYFPAVFDALSAGCLLAIVRPRLERYSTILSSRWMLAPIAITCALPLLDHHPHIFDGMVITCMNLGIALGIDHCIRREYKILNVWPVVWIGTLSYSLYLWQQPFLNTDARSLWTAFPLNVILAFVAAALSYYLVEQPALRLRERREIRLAASGAAAPQRATT
jgi:peptidoglycan/LPS O-acetylase OafA/YrhL